MGEYSIKDLENFTNIKAHTLRIWEQRYNLLKPKRTPTNIRYYSDLDVKKILNINLLYSNGYKISHIADMSEAEIMRLASEIIQSDNASENVHTAEFIKHILELDEIAIIKKLDHLNRQLGFPKLYVDVLIPLLCKIGDLWQVDTISVSHEHFFSNILRDFIITETGKVALPKRPKGLVILFLHEREMHELSLLYYHHLLRSRGYECIYLGQNVPIRDLKALVAMRKPDYLFTSVIAEMDRAYFAELFKQLTDFFPSKHIYVGGSQLKKISDLLPESVHQISGEKDIDL